MDRFKSNLEKIKQRIKNAALKYNRNLDDINLIAVSKSFPEIDILKFYDLGLRDFGESYIQEWSKKRLNLPNDINWHIIGHIQSNKTLFVANNATWVHGIDRLKVAQRLSNQRNPKLQLLNICIEVNISEDANKKGVLINDVTNLANLINKLPNLKLRGLMCIASDGDKYIINKQMQNMRELFLALQKSGFELDTLSMGMSSDLELAIANGATHVRIGRDLFGQR